MSNKWPSNSCDINGILKRKNPISVPQNNEKNLLIFGYGCKIFRDDEKAKYIDQGKHLIPWMGNSNHKIDRYDVRLTLTDLNQYEAPAGGYDNRLDYLSAEEKRAEELCEEERYYSLRHNEEEELMYQEEELKRLHQERSSSYGQVKFDYNSESTSNTDITNENDDDSKSVGEPDEVYTVMKNFNIPASIPLPDTMKQHAIIEKTAKFISTQGPQMEILIKAKQSNNPQFEFLNQKNILNQYYKFVLASLKDGTYPVDNDLQQKPQNNDNDGKLKNEIDVNIRSTSPQQISQISVPTIQYKPSENCAYTQLISKIKGVPLKVLTSSVHNNNALKHNNENTQSENNGGTITESKTDGVEIKKISSGLALAQCYSSDSESENDSDDEINQLPKSNAEPVLNFPIPPESEKNIIEKTAAYVAKNGKQFEETLKLKGDARFQFLHESHEYNPYYLYKVTGVLPIDNTSKAMNPVSFSIKSKEENSVAIKPALPQETSDDELDNQSDNPKNATCNIQDPNIQTPFPISKLPENVQKAIKLVENQLVAKSKVAAAGAHNFIGMLGNTIRSRFDIDCTGNQINRQLINVPPISNQILLENQKELKRAEEKVKDRLAQIAREKLGLISKEKQLQLERKKKAMAFLNQIKGSTEENVSETIDNNNDQMKNKDNDSDKESIRSIPISSYGDDDNNDDDNKSPYEYHHNRKPSPFLNTKQVSVDRLSESKNSHRSRSRSRSKSSRKRKKSKHRHQSSRKSSKKSSRSRSCSCNRSRSRSYSQASQSSSRKCTSSHKSKKRKRDRD